MRGHRQDSAQKWGLPCRWLFFIFSKVGVSFLGQKRAVDKWGVYTVISKNWLFFSWMFSFGHSRCLPIEEGTMSTLAAKQTFSRGCFFGHLAAYHLRKKIFFLLGLPFTPPYLRIYEGFFQMPKRNFLSEGDGHKRHLENISVGGLTLTPSNVRICERTFLRNS